MFSYSNKIIIVRLKNHNEVEKIKMELKQLISVHSLIIYVFILSVLEKL